MSEPKAGDVVMLKSGGPKMTCRTGKDSDGWVACQWFGKAGGPVNSGFFSPESLVIVPSQGDDAESDIGPPHLAHAFKPCSGTWGQRINLVGAAAEMKNALDKFIKALAAD